MCPASYWSRGLEVFPDPPLVVSGGDSLRPNETVNLTRRRWWLKVFAC
jgi:hypothetical protein